MRDMDVSNQKNQAKTKGVTWNWHLFFFSWLYFGGDLGQWRHADNNYRQFGTADGKTPAKNKKKEEPYLFEEILVYERMYPCTLSTAPVLKCLEDTCDSRLPPPIYSILIMFKYNIQTDIGIDPFTNQKNN